MSVHSHMQSQTALWGQAAMMSAIHVRQMDRQRAHTEDQALAAQIYAQSADKLAAEAKAARTSLLFAQADIEDLREQIADLKRDNEKLAAHRTILIAALKAADPQAGKRRAA